MPRLIEQLNVHSTCIALLGRKGWSVRIEPCLYEEEDATLDLYTATRDGTTIEASTPVALLGLASIHEHHHPHTDESYWWHIKDSDPSLLSKLEDDALERSFWSFHEREPAKCLATIKEAVADATSCSTPPWDILGISEASFHRFRELYPEIE